MRILTKYTQDVSFTGRNHTTSTRNTYTILVLSVQYTSENKTCINFCSRFHLRI